MFQWNPNMRNILKEGETSEENEEICREMIAHGYDFLIKKVNYGKPKSWSFAPIYKDQIENYIMEMSMPGSYTSAMVIISANHAAFIADYGWDKYAREMRKPEDISSVNQFFYDTSFDDYDPKNVEIKDPFEDMKGDIDIDDVDVEIYEDYEDDPNYVQFPRLMNPGDEV